MFSESNNIRIKNLIQNAMSLHSLGRLNEARQVYNEVILLDPLNDEAHHLLGVIAAQLGNYELSVEKISAAINLNPKIASYYTNLGNALFAMESYERAILNYDLAIKLKANYPEAYSNRGNALKAMNQLEDAMQSYNKAITLNPQYADAYYNRGITLYEMMKLSECIESFMNAIRFDTHNVEAYYNLAVAQHQNGDYESSIRNYSKAISKRENYAQAYCGRGSVYRILKRFPESIDDFKRVIKIDPNYEFAKGYLLHAKALSCDWNGIFELISEINSSVLNGEKAADPFSWQAATNSIVSLFNCAKIYASCKHPSSKPFSNLPLGIQKNKIRIGYVSGEFGDQATSHLLIGVLEHHNKERFEIFCFDNGYNDNSDLRTRIERSADKIISISEVDDNNASELIHNESIDILVNLNGYFGRQRNNLFSKRPSALQVNYLGFPGTMGADYIDYIIADKIVIPEEEQGFYTEKVIYMPYSYQPNDRDRIIDKDPGTRCNHGLPDNKFIFCCFNNSYKITPNVFDIWMNILSRVENSILWLLEDNPVTSSNLRNEAYIRNVDPNRLIFAPRVGNRDHLARHMLADLFLDTLPYNAHTTASDALWAGLPIITCSGKTFPGRVAHSLLSAVNLTELVAFDLIDYEQKAIELAENPDKLLDIKKRLNLDPSKLPLFDTKDYTSTLEKAFEKIYSNYISGNLPQHIYL